MSIRHWLGIISAGVLMATVPHQLIGDGGLDIDRIEEDWEVVIGEPNPDEESPQIINVIAPLGDTDGDNQTDLEAEFAVFELNHRTQPDYQDGGMQLQHWTGTQLDDVQSWTGAMDSCLLSTPDETITYTLRMSLYDSQLHFSVRNGQSETWGSFGGDSLRLVSDNTSLPNLNGYSTANSTTNSRIGYAGYRVTSFVLKQVRYYSNGQLVRTDDTDYVVHEYHP